ncbi:beta-ketoacyl synthase [Hypoxylon trugodes]|uniref:beta-ketoacyl synthase n=1 Tax=Hypoxylon trugodes TaxID=326681 RepID=UPI00218EA05D|nr:beta-ketoacyl synthase [Hypoxylon trugodes]KAI1391904.1 beta-ketoacyl synthase [Hypoxylon trugodes]
MEFITHIQGDVDSHHTPLFLIHAISGLALPFFRLHNLSHGKFHRSHSERPVYGVSSPIYSSEEAIYPSSFEELALLYISEIKTIQPHGPYLLGGWSLGGMIAMKMAQILLEQGESVSRVIMIDSANPEAFPPFRSSAEFHAQTAATIKGVVAEGLPVFLDAEEGASSDSESSEEEDDDGLLSLRETEKRIKMHISKSLLLLANITPGEFSSTYCDTHVVLVKCAADHKNDSSLHKHRAHQIRKVMRDKTMKWDTSKFREFETVPFSGDHDGAFGVQHVGELSKILHRALHHVR